MHGLVWRQLGLLSGLSSLGNDHVMLRAKDPKVRCAWVGMLVVGLVRLGIAGGKR